MHHHHHHHHHHRLQTGVIFGGVVGRRRGLAAFLHAGTVGFRTAGAGRRKISGGGIPLQLSVDLRRDPLQGVCERDAEANKKEEGGRGETMEERQMMKERIKGIRDKETTWIVLYSVVKGRFVACLCFDSC